MSIPYGKQTIDNSDISAVSEVLSSDFLTTGPKVREFEEAIAKYTGAKYVVAVSNGTAGLHLASLILLKKGDRVLTTPNSFLATANSILYAGATPVFIDIAEDGNINLDLAMKYIEEKQANALYGVHFSGNPLDFVKLQKIKTHFQIPILEDSAHAIGGRIGGKMIGSSQYSDISIFSFHPVKNMTTGEGGAILTNNEKTYEKLLSLRNHGMIKTSSMKPWEYEMRDLGYNYRITDIQSALGLSQLKKLDLFLEKRRQLAMRYEEKFKGTIVKPLYKFNPNSAYHLFVVRIDFHKAKISKEQLFLKLREENIFIQLHYMPINKQPYYKSLGYGDEITPVMDRYYKEAISLPLYPKLSFKEQDLVVETILKFV
jgi:UDP-4-amino-4,6-dideoxy-L-N-acetyl-beta-L-altrosamine transaminase